MNRIARMTLADPSEAIQLLRQEKEELIEEDLIMEEEEEEVEGKDDEEVTLESTPTPQGSVRSVRIKEPDVTHSRKPRKSVGASHLQSSRMRSLTRTAHTVKAENKRTSAYGFWMNSAEQPQFESMRTLMKAKTAFSPSAFGAPGGSRYASPAEPHRLRTWQMLYCGGAQAVVDSLSEISRVYNIKLRVEKFDW